MNTYISSDHGGFELKQQLLNQLQDLNIDVIDMGPYELNLEDDFPDYAIPLAQKVATEPDSIGILICRSGNGMAMAANKVNGAYAALCFSKLHAQKAREDDNANIVVLDADYDIGDDPIDIVSSFVNAQFKGMDTKYGRRFLKIKDFELGNK